jgi:PhnB protein
MRVEPYLFFDGCCEEAIEFYKTAVGARVNMLMRFKESPEPHAPGQLPPGSENKVLHATMRIGNSVVMMSDGHCAGRPKFEGFHLSLTVSNDTEAERAFNALSAGGKVTMPLGKTFYASSFGMLIDQYGVGWMVIVGP